MLPVFPEDTGWNINYVTRFYFLRINLVALSCDMSVPTAVCSLAVLCCMQERNVRIP